MTARDRDFAWRRLAIWAALIAAAVACMAVNLYLMRLEGAW